MKDNFKLLMIAGTFLLVISCTVSEDVKESSVAWDATNYTMFNEFMECSPGDDFTEELMMQMIADWRDFGLSDSLLGSWGYAPASENNTVTNGQWELSWTSKEDAEKAWGEWMASEDAKAWGDKYASVLQCDSENRNGYEFVFPYNPYNFGPTSEDGSFAANFMPCTLNDGMDQTSLSNGLIAYNNWLDGLDSGAVGGFYAYGLYVPVDSEAEVDYWFGNFHIDMDGMDAGMALWDETGGTAKEALENTGTCANPEIFRGQVFYDPANPDFS